VNPKKLSQDGRLQSDFTSIRRGAECLSMSITTLGWSRATYAEFIGDERLETLLSCHEHASTISAECRTRCYRVMWRAI